MSALAQRQIAVDPPVRADGYCAGPNCRKRRNVAASKRYAKDAAAKDPFCSRECCETYHAVVQSELRMDGPDAA